MVKTHGSHIANTHVAPMALLAGLALLGGLGCAKAPAAANATSAGSGSESSPLEQKGPVDINAYPLDKIVCDPFSSDTPLSPGTGLKANLFYLPKNAPRAGNLAEAFAQATPSDRQFFFSALNIPTRDFDGGFADGLGQVLKDENGEPLTDSFALHFQSTLKLAPSQKPGRYEFALLSDDGAVLRLRDSDGEYRAVVDGDGAHPTRLSCGTRTVDLSSDSELMFELDYHQGASRPMALVLLMREVLPNQEAEIACGRQGDGLWFNSGQGSAPKAEYLELLARGWRPLQPENFALPEGTLYNPCFDGGLPPRVIDLEVEEAAQDGFVVKWATDIPAMSQVSAIDLQSGLATLTASDNVLRRHHSVRVDGLRADAAYALSAVVVSEKLGKGFSRPVQARTRP